MFLSLPEVGELLSEWRDSTPPPMVSVRFSGEPGTVYSLACSGTILSVHLTRFVISWGAGASVEFRYDTPDVSLSDDKRSLHFAYSLVETLALSKID